MPSGASTGQHEALELRDGDGKGVTRAIDNVNNIIIPALIKSNINIQDPDVMRKVDQLMIDLDGTENKSNLGANAILGISMAVAVAAAKARGISLDEFLHQQMELRGIHQRQSMPVPMINIINGGAHVQADQKPDIQEFMIMPVGARSIKQAMKWSQEVFNVLGQILKERGIGPKNEFDYGNEKGYKPALKTNEEGLQLLMEAIKRAGYQSGTEIAIALDVASTEFFDSNKGTYHFEGKDRTAAEMIEIYKSWVAKYPIISIEDGLAEDDWTNWRGLTEAVGDRVQLVGDDLFVTNLKRLQRGIDEKTGNAVLIKLNQIGTVTETLDAIAKGIKAGFGVIISHRSGETEDTFISDLSVGTGAGQIKTGGLAHWPADAESGRPR